MKDNFSSESCPPSRDIISNNGNKTTQVESIKSNNQPETIGRLRKDRFTINYFTNNYSENVW